MPAILRQGVALSVVLIAVAARFTDAQQPPFAGIDPAPVASPYAIQQPGAIEAAASLGAGNEVVPVQYAPPLPPTPPPYTQLPADVVDLSAIPHPAAGDPVPLVAAAPTPPLAAQEQLTQAELLERLQQAEARLKQLESRSSPLADPKTGDMLRTLRERWDKVQDPSITTVEQQTYSAGDKKASEKKWYDRLSIRGYAQFRYNEVLNRAPGSVTAHHVGDRSIGEDQGFLIRRARVILSGDVSDHMYVYLQPDFASTPNGSVDNIHFTQIRDWYGDLYLTENKVHRIRIGQSKIPYGWENLQSSSNRLALDRSDAINSAARNERDLGLFYYWTPEPAQDFFKAVLDEGLKGSGNYGVFGLGLYNGQGGSLAEQNDDFHLISRLTVPYTFDGGQRMEVGVQGYMGRYTVLSSEIRPLGVGAPARPLNTLENTGRRGINDERIAGTFVWYPQPIGFQAEWNLGRSPALNAAQTAVEERALYGGYFQTMAKIDTDRLGTVFPFVRWVYYQGGQKAERNAPFTEINEWEFGTEWQINSQMELTSSYLFTDRTNTTALTAPGSLSYQQFDGSVMRLQFQINY